MNRIIAAAALFAFSAIAAAQAPVDAEVKKIDKPAARIVLKHGEIKQFDMPPMTGTYKVAEPGMLDKVQPGDHVKFTLDRLNNQYTITKIDVVK